MLTLDEKVVGLESTLGEIFHGSRPLTAASSKGSIFPGVVEGGAIPVFHQLLPANVYYLGFEAGSQTAQVLTNDQNRFPLPRSLPPILSLRYPEDEDNAEFGYVVTRHAHSEGAYSLLHELLAEGHVFSLNEFLALVRNLAEAFAFLHEHEIVHGQWNARSVIAIPEESRGKPRRERPVYRFEVLNTGVCFRESAKIPPEFLEHEYYPREIFHSSTGSPDYGAIDLETDVYGFAAFLKDILQRACSSEDLTSQATRIHDRFQRDANRKGLKSTPEKLRQKEQEILDHLYTIKVRTEALIQEGLRSRGRRSSAGPILELAVDLHEKATAYHAQLFQRGFDPLNVFGNQLQHYTAFQLTVSPRVINSFEDSEVTLTGGGLPYELVRITLSDRDQGVHVIDAEPGRIVFQVSRGFPEGIHKLSINNRRTNARLEVHNPLWKHIEPTGLHQPWEGFGNICVRFVGERLPHGADYGFRRAPETDGRGEVDEVIPVLSSRVVARGAASTGEPSAEIAGPTNLDGGDPAAHSVAAKAGGEGDPPPPPSDETLPGDGEICLELELPPETPPGAYELCANGLATGLQLEIKERLAAPRVGSESLDPDLIKNHKQWSIQLRGENFHPQMVLDLGERTPAGFRYVVESGEGVTITIPRRFPAGEYTLRVNYQDTRLKLRVVAPTWHAIDPPNLKFPRRGKRAVRVTVQGDALPPIAANGAGYTLRSGRGLIKGGVVGARVTKEEATHQVEIASTVPRGRPRLYFSDLDTGLRVRIRKPWALATWAAILVVSGSLLTAIGIDQKNRWAPRITAVSPELVFKFRRPEIAIEGRHLSKVELLDAHGVGHAVPLLAGEAAGAYRFPIAGIPAGQYRLRPVGPLYGNDVTDLTLTILSPRLTIEPTMVHRLDDVHLTLSAAPGFSLREHVIDTLELTPVARDVAPTTLPVTADGYVDIPAGTFRADAEGEYRVSVDGEPLMGLTATGPGTERTRAAPETTPAPVMVHIVGPHISALKPDPVTVGADGNVTLSVDGSQLPDDLWLGLVGGDDRVVHRVFPMGLSPEQAPRTYRGAVVPGAFRLAIGRGDPEADGGYEILPALTLEVLPRPEITDVSPRQMEPSRPGTLHFEGVNLDAAERIVLSATSPDRENVEVPIDPERVTGEKGRAGSYRADVVLSSGGYLVEPSATRILIEVFDDCRKLLEAYAAGEVDAEAITQCVIEERPAESLVLEVAALFFDQGHFEKARLLYDGRPSARARFRVALIDEFIGGRGSSFAGGPDDPINDPYSIAARRLGWSAGDDLDFPSEAALPWELEFVRGVTSPEPRDAVSSLELAIATKTQVCRGTEARPFEPARVALTRARLDVAVDGIRRSSVFESADALSALLASAEAVERLDADDRARAAFWHGHLQLWYLGDEEAAVASFHRATQEGAAAAARWSNLYLKILDPGGLEGGESAPAVAAAGDGWVTAFLDVFRYYREITRSPNYNLLTERYDFNVYLSQDERQKSIAFHKSLRELEQRPAPQDPFAHFALLYYLRNAQRIAWPQQEGGAKANEYRGRLIALETPERVEPLRHFYLCQGNVGPLDSTQFSVFSAVQKKAFLDQIQAVSVGVLPASFKEEAEGLKQKLLAKVGSSE